MREGKRERVTEGGREEEMDGEREWEKRGREREGTYYYARALTIHRKVVFYCFIRLVVSYNQFNGSLALCFCVQSQIIIGVNSGILSIIVQNNIMIAHLVV